MFFSLFIMNECPLRAINVPEDLDSTAVDHLPQASEYLSRKRRRATVKVTARDLSILRFVFEMKFASVEHIYRRFFSRTLALQPSASESWARRRVLTLERSGYLQAHAVATDRLKYYAMTPKSFRLLSETPSIVLLGRPQFHLDHHAFNHDRLVLHERLVLESAHGEILWISDRAMQTGALGEFVLERKYLPDAIYQLPNRPKVALEVEVSVKGKRAYQEKIAKYARYFRRPEGAAREFESVRFLCHHKLSFKHLSDFTKVYGSQFVVELASPPQPKVTP